MSKIKIHFDPNQEHQNEAVASIVELFDGLFRADTGAYELGDEITPNIPPYYQLDQGWLQDNLQEIQRRNNIKESLSVDVDSGFMVEGVSVDTWEYPSFTIDMETGTGKTYVYLKTIYELFKHYGLRKYVIIVPSIAIYEGGIKAFQMTREHFKALYGNVNATLLKYEGSKPNLLKNFAVGKDIEILVMTIDSFNKRSNTIFKKTDKLMGERYPFQYIQETRPILILDESQNYTTEKSKAALRTLKPLFAINYSATPGKEAPNTAYKLTPFEAFQKNLVKKIEVLGMIEAQNTVQNEEYIRLVAIGKRGKNIIARFHLMVNSGGSLEDKEIEVSGKANLETKTKNPAYTGWIVDEINLKEEFVSFKNGERFNLSEERLVSISRETLFKHQIEETIKIHLSKQKELKAYGIKILTLFFIDRVANYVENDGVIKRIFDETFERLKNRNPDFSQFKPSDVREGYFAKKKGTKKEPECFIDTALENDSKTVADKEAEKAAYELIMKKKEQLLSFEEPVCFIFAHSALREGWDNPNVFQICALREISSEKQRRQTVGRGLRLPVTQSGYRMMDRRLNTLTVIANESYNNYVDRLQKEYAETGDLLPSRPANASEKETAKRNQSIYNSRDFKNFWNKLIQKTEYQINIETEEFIKLVVNKLNTTAFPEPHIVITKGNYIITNYRLDLLDVQGQEAKIKLSKSDSLGQEESSVHFYKAGNDLAKLTKNPIYKGFKIVEISGEGETGRIMFSEAGELNRDKAILFSTEQGQSFTTRHESEVVGNLPKFNLVERTARELSMTRETVLSIFKKLNKGAKESFVKNPEDFAGIFIQILKDQLADHVAERIEYTITEEIIERDTEQMFPEDKTFPKKELIAGNETSSIYDLVQCDSENEFKFVERLNDDENVILFFKFPPAFKIRIPRIIGNYNPDWGMLRWDDQHRLKLELVRETKGNLDLAMLQHSNEGRKIRCAEKHFASLGVSYRHVTSETTDWWKEEERKTEVLIK